MASPRVSAFTSWLAALPAAAAAQAPDGAAPTAVHSVGEWIRERVPDTWRNVGFIFEPWQWVGIAGLLALAWVLSRIVRLILGATGRRAFGRFVPTGDPRRVTRAAHPLGHLVGALFLRVAVYALGLPPEALAPILVATSFVAAAAGVITAYRLVDLFSAHFEEKARATASRFDDLLVPMLRKAAKIVILAFGVLFVADNLDVDISSLLAGLGLGGLAFALAAQDTVKNLFGSVTVLVDKPFQVGDFVTIDTLQGTVTEVGFRSTRLRTPADTLVTVPNANLISTNVENLGARTWRRWLSRLGVTYDTPPAKVEAFCEGIRELARRREDTRKEAIEVWANEFGATSIEIILSVYFRSTTWSAEMAARHDLVLEIMTLAEGLKVEFAFPTQTLHVLRPGELPGHEPLESGEAARARGREIAAIVAAQSAARSEAQSSSGRSAS